MRILTLVIISYNQRTYKYIENFDDKVIDNIINYNQRTYKSIENFDD